MEDFLKESPFEEPNNGNNRNTSYTNYQPNEFSLDLTQQRSGELLSNYNDYNNPEYSNPEYTNPEYTNPEYNSEYNTDYTSPTNYQSPNTFQPSSSFQSPLPHSKNDSSNNLNTVPSNDPYYGTFEFLQPMSPHQQPQQSIPPAQEMSPQGGVFAAGAYLDPLQFNMGETYNNLDLLVSPDNGSGPQALDMFSTAQYFSPNSRQNHFNHLNSIAEDSLPGSFQNTVFTPNMSRHGSVSIPPLNNDAYLSPQSKPFVSPQSRPHDGSYDALKSPYATGTHMNSPPPPLNLNLSKSIPSAVNFNQPSFRDQRQSIEDALSPPLENQYSLGSSAPSSSKRPEPFSTTKSMSQEEKVKRRREFHNAVERRRRDLIKEKIKELGFLVPPSLLNPQVSAVQVLLRPPHLDSPEVKELLSLVKVKESKPNKAAILLCSVDYIKNLKGVARKQDARRQELEGQIAELERGFRGLKTENDSMPSYTSSLDFQRQHQLSQSTSDFNPDDFFSDVINDPNQY